MAERPDTEGDTDVLVIGGGPAGSTIATLLRQRGWRITLLEKDRHPRFHIGESLLPMNLTILRELGVLEQVREIGVVKHGAEFGATADATQTVYFGNAMDKGHPYAFQVRRSEFDHLLLKNSVERGVDVREGVRVMDAAFRPGQRTSITAIADDGQKQVWKTRFVIDASGRDTFLARKLDLKRKNPKHQSAAVFGHFKNAERRPGDDGGNIGIYWFPHGWFWMIPLRDDVMSVGAVCWPEYLKTRRTDLEEFLWDTIRLCPAAHERMRRAQACSEIQATGNYSYRATRLYGDGYLLVGDAFAFIDPVFSTGVYFAMSGAQFGADAVDAYLRDPDQSRALFRRFERRLQRAIKIVSWFIYRFTSPALQQLFMAPRNTFRIEEAIISMLAGDVFRNTPTALPLALFKGIYRAVLLANASRAWASYRRRRRNAHMNFPDGPPPREFH
jgi:flavin-dependent dehydrogenase